MHSFFHLIKVPFWIISIFTGSKSFIDNPVLGNSVLNTLGLHTTRIRLANFLSNLRRNYLSKYVEFPKTQEYLKNGFIINSNFLEKSEFDALKKEVFESSWMLREMKQGNAITRRVFLNLAELQTAYPKLANFISSTKVLSQIKYVAGVGGQPIFSLQAIFSSASSVGDPQTIIHADTFHSNAKAWFFLEDVNEADGPFSYVPGSHLVTPKRLSWEKRQSIKARHHSIIYHARGSFRATEADLKDMNVPNVKKFIVPQNTLVVANMFGFHARTISTRPTTRFEIYATLRRNPFIPWIGLDIFSLPYIKSWTGVCSIKMLTFLSKFGLRKMPWKLAKYGKLKENLTQ